MLTRSLNVKVALPLNVAVTWPYRRNVVFAICEFNHADEEQKRFYAWLSEHFRWPLLQGHVCIARTRTPWDYFDCSKAKNTAHIMGVQLAGSLQADLRKTYLINLDGDNIFSEEWLLSAFSRAEEECASVPKAWVNEILAGSTQPSLRNLPQAGLTAEQAQAGLTAEQAQAGLTAEEAQAGLTARRSIFEYGIDIPTGIKSGTQWVSCEMGTYGRIGVPAIIFALLRGYDEELIGMGIQDWDLVKRLGAIGWNTVHRNQKGIGFSVPNRASHVRSILQNTKWGKRRNMHYTDENDTKLSNLSPDIRQRFTTFKELCSHNSVIAKRKQQNKEHKRNTGAGATMGVDISIMIWTATT